jgi:hypothetical protein
MNVRLGRFDLNVSRSFNNYASFFFFWQSNPCMERKKREKQTSSMPAEKKIDFQIHTSEN